MALHSTVDKPSHFYRPLEIPVEIEYRNEMESYSASWGDRMIPPLNPISNIVVSGDALQDIRRGNDCAYQCQRGSVTTGGMGFRCSPCYFFLETPYNLQHKQHNRQPKPEAQVWQLGG
jgi:hypothetical protein